MKKLLVILLTILLVIPAGMTVTSAAGLTDTTGEKLTNPSYELKMMISSSYCRPGDTLQVAVTVNNIIPDDGIALLKFLLFYDRTKVEPVVKNDGMMNKQMNDFLEKAPDMNAWRDGVCKLDETKGLYDISFFTAERTNLAKQDGSIIIVIPFKVKYNVSGIINFMIPNGNAGTKAIDSQMQRVYGNGDYVFSVMSGNIPITGAVSISGIGIPGQTLTADISKIRPAGCELAYVWYRDSEIINGTGSNTYTVADSDVGKMISVVVYGINNYGGIMMSFGLEISEAINVAPPAPSLFKKGQNEIILWPYSGCEYKIKDGVWQDSTVFSGLTAGQTYKFYARFKTPAGSQSGPESNPFSITLDKPVGVGDDINNELTYGCLNGLPEKLTTDDVAGILGGTAIILDSEGNELTTGGMVGTGMIFFNGTALPIIIKGDVNGDGVVDSVDCLLLKKAIIGTGTLEGVYFRAACINGTTTPDSSDYLKIKKHILGNFNLYN